MRNVETYFILFFFFCSFCSFLWDNKGTGGRIRDVQAAGRGGHVIAGTAGYSFGNLLLENYDLPWENKDEIYPSNFATPSEIIIEASNGASDYGNKFGEPVILGFCRSCGLRETNGRVKRITSTTTSTTKIAFYEISSFRFGTLIMSL